MSVIVSGGRAGYDLVMCGHIEGPAGTQVLPALGPDGTPLLSNLDPVRRQATEIAWGQRKPPSDDTLRRLLVGLQRLWTEPDERSAP